MKAFHYAFIAFIILLYFLSFTFIYFFINYTTLTGEQAYERSRGLLKEYCAKENIDCLGFRAQRISWQTEKNTWIIDYYNSNNGYYIYFEVPDFGFTIMNVESDTDKGITIDPFEESKAT